MQLTRYTDYGLRLLIYLALLPEKKRASIDEISEIYDISRNNLNKIVHQLGKEGIIETQRGKGGGFCLKIAPQDINVGEIVMMLENTMLAVDCQSRPCRILPVCELRGVLEQATQSFINTLKEYTLADLLHHKQRELAQILTLAK